MNNWIKTADHTPELPDRNYCHIMVLASFNGDEYSRPMFYERIMVRGQRVERWRYYYDRIAPTPDYWMPLPLAHKES